MNTKPLILGLLFLIGSAGCSRTPTLSTIAVHGKVTYRGAPVEQGTITFQPLEPAQGHPKRPAVGSLNTDGTYELSSFARNDGAVPGDYRVVIVSLTSGPTLEQANAPEVWAIPKKYGNPLQSDLKATIPADAQEPLQLDFLLED